MVTDEMVERAERAYWDTSNDPEGARDMRAALEAALSAAEPKPAPSVAVKALEWTTPHPSTTYPEWRTMGLGFEAVIDKSKPLFYGDFPLRINGRHTIEKFETLEAAKAFAQADYEARIRSALSAQVQDVAGWQSMETAPKDGTTFIAVMAEAYSPRATLCKFEDGKFLSPSQGEKFVVPGWNQWWPTHWMPLPTAPAAPAKQEGGTNG